MSLTDGRVVVVCTANICRSPMAAALLRHHLASRSTVNAPFVASAGFLEPNRPVDPFAASTIARRGLHSSGADISTHRSTQLDPALLRSVDLVITMTAEHVRHVVDMAPQTWPKVFTIAELANRIASNGPRRPDETLARYVARLHAGRTAAAAMNAGTAGDIDDPFGGPLSAFDRTADRLDRYTAQIAAALAGVSTGEIANPGVAPAAAREQTAASDPVPRPRRFFRRSR